MKRAPMVLAFHPKTRALSLGTLPATDSTRGSSPSTPPTSSPSTSSPAAGSSSPTSTTTAPPAAQTFAGDLANYGDGVLSVQVTVQGHRITKDGIAPLNDGGNFRSQSIDQQAIPILEQQAPQAQSAHIQGVSGASSTSSGFAQSLQSARTKAGL